VRFRHVGRIGTPKLLDAERSVVADALAFLARRLPLALHVSSETRRLTRRREGCRDRVAVVVPSERFRRSIVAQLTALGYEARGTGSLDEAFGLVEANAIDTLVLHVSAFSARVLAQLDRAIRGRRSIALIASVSVVSVPDLDRYQVIERQDERPAPGGGSPWRVATYWVPFSRFSEFSIDLSGPNPN
jgi:hypothetical protein